jgi:FlaA1/EpsC-like NDP-sugar epimerase
MKVKNILNLVITMQDFNFDFQEQSTRKAVVLAVAGSLIFYFLFYNEYLFNLQMWGRDTLVNSLVASAIFGAVSFLLGMIFFREKNLTVLAFFPAWYLSSLFVSNGAIRDIEGTVGCLVGGFIVSMVAFLILGFALKWIREGN